MMRPRPAAIAIVLLSVLTACGQSSAPPAPAASAKTGAIASGSAQAAAKAAGKRIVVATGGTGGVFYPLGTGLSKMLQKYLGVESSAEVTAASVANFKLIRERHQDVLAFAQADVAYDALEGREAFRADGPLQIRSLGVLYLNMMQLVVRDGTGINSAAELRGRQVSVGDANSGTEIKANRVLEAAGLDPAKDIQRQHLGVGESATAMEQGKLDAFFFDGGIPTPAIADLANKQTVKLIPHGDLVAKMNAKYGDFYAQVLIPKDTYKGMTADVPSVAGLPNILAVHEEFPEDLSYGVLATLFDHKAEWDAIHPEAKFAELRTAWQNSPIPLHPGAIRFYRDRGVYRGS
jgi:TRAP transporter TAXI family solute receptor